MTELNAAPIAYGNIVLNDIHIPDLCTFGINREVLGGIVKLFYRTYRKGIALNIVADCLADFPVRHSAVLYGCHHLVSDPPVDPDAVLCRKKNCRLVGRRCRFCNKSVPAILKSIRDLFYQILSGASSCGVHAVKLDLMLIVSCIDYNF